MALSSDSEGSPKLKSHVEKRVRNQGLTCKYLEAKRRGKGKKKEYVSTLEMKIARLENALRSGLPADRVSVGPSYASDHRSDEMATKTLGSTSEFGPGDVRPLAHTDGRSSTALPPTETEGPYTSRVVAQASGTRNSGSNLPTPKSSIGTSSAISAVRERFFASLPDSNVVRRLRTQMQHGGLTSSIFTHLSSKAHLETLFKEAYSNTNCQWPLFDHHSLIQLLDEEYASDGSSIHKSPARWGLLNSALAIAIQSKAAEDSYSGMIDLSWHFFKTSFGVFPAIAARGTDIVALEALLAMALFMQGSSDARTTSLLVSEAARLSTTLGFHRSSFYMGMDHITAERHKRAFWIAYILDKDISIKTRIPSSYNDDDISLGYPSPDSLGCPGKTAVSEIRVDAAVFRLRAQLAVIESCIQNQLYSEKATNCGPDMCSAAVSELNCRLEDWKGQVAATIRPGHVDWSTVGPGRETILALHLVYYRAMNAVHSWAAYHMPVDGINLASQSISSNFIHTTMAHASIQLLQFLPPLTPGCLWQTLFYPLSACLALVAVLLKHPADIGARSHLRHMSDFVQFLTQVQKRGVLDVERMRHLCIELEKLVFEIVTAEKNIAHSTKFPVGDQKIYEKIQVSPKRHLFVE
ncbi:hypothetical protein PV08_11921 [Exophiala spinifera]|uniref:Xylanolytic transcriptional activator regulatory domain-containing protein n=1 Tax=Exophiala spinifera TaxID=91928 RepID=A0A0D2ATG9_9EURO|nr:uncharacterized protein PV08_11921 [Exophiala spinifera]KIW09820.1 hypothetical protein PV08_11921 [Exophiala spinifera]